MMNGTNSPQSLASGTKQLRIIWLILLVTIILYASAAENSKTRRSHPTVHVFEAITFLAILIVLTMMRFRQKYVAKNAERLTQNPNDTAAFKRWRTGYLGCFISSESIALYGVCLRYMGFGFSAVAPFYVAGFALMLFSRPKNPVEAGPFISGNP